MPNALSKHRYRVRKSPGFEVGDMVGNWKGQPPRQERPRQEDARRGYRPGEPWLQSVQRGPPECVTTAGSVCIKG